MQAVCLLLRMPACHPCVCQPLPSTCFDCCPLRRTMLSSPASAGSHPPPEPRRRDQHLPRRRAGAGVHESFEAAAGTPAHARGGLGHGRSGKTGRNGGAMMHVAVLLSGRVLVASSSELPRPILQLCPCFSCCPAGLHPSRAAGSPGTAAHQCLLRSSPPEHPCAARPPGCGPGQRGPGTVQAAGDVQDASDGCWQQ